jgi:uncharacterized protein YceH (UPF0502 family)
MQLPVLSLAETRVLGVLVEKERTVADIYPLSLNALVAGCNQKNNRDPVLALSEAEVQAALDRLKQLSLAIESSGARVARYSHNLGRVLKVPSQAEALLTVLFLRGPQTAGELRIGAERLHRFADISAVEAFLEELADRTEAQGCALVVKLPRRPGEREQRWAHLLSGAVEVEPAAQPAAHATETAVATGNVAALRLEIEVLREEVRALRAEVAALRAAAPSDN